MRALERRILPKDHSREEVIPLDLVHAKVALDAPAAQSGGNELVRNQAVPDQRIAIAFEADDVMRVPVWVIAAREERHEFELWEAPCEETNRGAIPAMVKALFGGYKTLPHRKSHDSVLILHSQFIQSHIELEHVDARLAK